MHSMGLRIPRTHMSFSNEQMGSAKEKNESNNFFGQKIDLFASAYRPKSYARYWTGTSLQVRLMQKLTIKNVNKIGGTLKE